MSSFSTDQSTAQEQPTDQLTFKVGEREFNAESAATKIANKIIPDSNRITRLPFSNSSTPHAVRKTRVLSLLFQCNIMVNQLYDDFVKCSSNLSWFLRFVEVKLLFVLYNLALWRFFRMLFSECA